MKVIDHEPHGWYLLVEGEALILDVNCNHNSFGYSFTIQLNPEEVAEYRIQGRNYIGVLAQRIQDSVPILADSTSAFKTRCVTSFNSNRIMAAVREWSEIQTAPDLRQ